LGELNSLIASYTQIKEYCSIPYNVDSYDGSANNGIDACINFLDNFRKHFKQAFNESMTDIEVLRKIEQSQDDLGQNLEGLLK
jgi:hypothetical protein